MSRSTLQVTHASPNEALLDALEQFAPGSVLAISAGPIPALSAYRESHPDCQVMHCPPASALAQLEDLERFDVALVADALEQLDTDTAEQLLGRLRNLHSAHLLVVVTDAAALSRNQLFGLGLVQTARFEHRADDRALNLYSYDIASYNHVREWNNPRFWANPEMWGKYWW